jgi:hypothetical protein
MSASSAIGKVSRSLRSLLLNEMTLDSVRVTVLAPDEPGGGDPRINLFLYKVQEHAALRNMDWQVKLGDPGRLVPPPLSLKLFYLMTAYAANQDESGNASAHELLGEAMRVLYQNPVVPDDYLGFDFAGARERVKVVLNSLDLEELSKIWSTFTQPFRLSVLYEVSVVQLDMLPEKERPMARRVETIGVPEIGAPFAPPCVDEIQPRNAPAGATITFQGRNLAGWKAYVSIMGRAITDGIDCASESFEATIPADLPPGFHEVRIDISSIFRRLFFYEVTA